MAGEESFVGGGETKSIYHGVKIKTTAIKPKARRVFLSTLFIYWVKPTLRKRMT